MDTSNVCRLCLELQGTISDFRVLNENKPLVELIFELLDIEIKLHHGSYYLCNNCHEVLRNFNEFKSKCYINDIEFRSRYQECEQEPQFKIEIEDSVIQSEIQSSIEAPEEEIVIPSESIVDNNAESDLASKDSEINDTQSSTEKPEEESIIPSETVVGNSTDSDSATQGEEINKTQNKKKPKKTTDRKPPKIPCHLCGKLVNKYGYKVHISLHDKSTQRFKCEICGRTYRQKHNLKVHLRIHTKEKLFPCKEKNCGRVFNWAASLRDHHKTMHTNIKDHICEICGQGFKIPSGLRSHLRSHSTEKIHPCPECGRLFKRKPEVKKHLKLHSRAGRIMPRVVSTLETSV